MASIQVREATSGPRYDVYFRVDGVQRKRTFRRRKEAESFKRNVEGAETAGLLIDPKGGETVFGAYVERWLDTRLVRGRPLTPATRQGYRGLLRRHILPEFGRTPLRKITAERVRHWHAALAQSAGADQAAKAYRVLRAVLNTAVADSLIGRNPCMVRGGGVERAAERPLVDTGAVYDLADAIEPRLRAFVLLAAFGGLRSGEQLALERRDVDEVHRLVHVRREAQEIAHIKDAEGNVVERHGRVVGDPKTDAGKRSVAIPSGLVDELRAHLDAYVAPQPDALLFTRPSGRYLRRQDLSAAWRAACVAVGLTPWSREHPEGIRPHDLRHHAATLTARTPGVTEKEIQARLGHASPRAARLYQHAVQERDQRIAEHLDEVMSGAQRAKVVTLPR